MTRCVDYVKANIDENGRLDYARATENARVILALTAIGQATSPTSADTTCSPVSTAWSTSGRRA